MVLRSYKMRAECFADIARFIEIENIETLTCKRFEGLPDVEATFSSTESLKDIRKLIGSIPDGHVMLETICLEEDYTGIRERV